MVYLSNHSLLINSLKRNATYVNYSIALHAFICILNRE